MDGFAVFEQVFGTVADMLGEDVIPEDTVAAIILDVIKALQVMHSQSMPFMHRNICAENIFQAADGKYKLGNFFHAKQVINTKLPARMALEIMEATDPAIRAPELQNPYSGMEIGTKADVWAVGCLVHLLLYNEGPFLPR
jgi:serine/threonine protein kinase